MAIFLLILPNMENVTFKSLDKTTLVLHFQNFETTFYSSILKVGETKVPSDFKICQCNGNVIFSTFKFPK